MQIIDLWYMRRHDWHHILIAFLIGMMTSYVMLILSIRIGHPSLGLAVDFDQESPWGSLEQIETRVQWPCQVPHQIGLSPMVLKDLTGNALATPDKLIVAARHADVSSLQS